MQINYFRNNSEQKHGPRGRTVSIIRTQFFPPRSQV